MPRRAYIAELQKLSLDSGIVGLTCVRQGDDDDEFRFKLSLDDASTVDISAMVMPNVGDYPDSHWFHLFLADDNASANVASTLSNLPTMKGRDVRSLLELVAHALRLDRDGDSGMIDNQDEEDELDDASSDASGDEPFGYDYDDYRAVPVNAANIGETSMDLEWRNRIRSDLRLVKEAGFKVGHCGAILNGKSCYLSVSTRISKLGISEEAMQAWHVKPAQYLILVIFYPDGYRSCDTITSYGTSVIKSNISFRVGLSDTYKPTLEELTSMFTPKLLEKKETPESHNEVDDDSDDKTQSEREPTGWRNSFISRPLGELLNGRFVPILKLRYKGMPWAGAERYFYDLQGARLGENEAKHVDNKYLKDDLTHSKFPPMVNADHIQDAHPSQLHSLPLLAMQFTLRHFVRSTEFCMVCHCRLENQLEAIKPYVCDRGLCLYQYMSLGFGPSIEHDIITQPYVVDLLVSFCYSSALSGKLKTLPTGLSLLVPNPRLVPWNPPDGYPYFPPSESQPLTHNEQNPAAVKFDRTLMELIYDNSQSVDLKVGDWVVISPVDAVAGGAAKAPNILFQHRRVASTFGSSVKLAKVNDELNLLGDILPNQTDAQIKPTSTMTADDAPGQMMVFVYKYDTNFDCLPVSEQQVVLMSQLKLLPRISQLKEYLTQTKMATLSTWVNRLSPTVVAILRWIIASNRACIMQIDKSPAEVGTVRLHGMGEWMQFRFAMGAPDKEQRFLAEVKSVAKKKSLVYPTAFAWHGSPVENWHSIIREGLHFKTITHGRAYGHGVYHSLDYATSAGYIGHMLSATSHWGQSELMITSAIALNEVVNAPDSYVSRTPHLVISQLDWIQTRYLFVRCSQATPYTNAYNVDTLPPKASLFKQDPTMTPRGEVGLISIPLEAVPRSRRPTSKLSPSNPKKKQKLIHADADGCSVSTLDEDRDLLLSDNEKEANEFEDDDFFDPTHPTKTEISAETESAIKGDSSSSVTKKFKFFKLLSKSTPATSAPAAPAAPAPSSATMTDFVPGHLDHSRLPALAPPQNASPMATQQLMKRFNSCKKTQESTPLHELGWFIDPEQLNNMFQWIVELHSFPEELPLAKQMKHKGITSIILELRFTDGFPFAPPFVRVIEPRFLPFAHGGGGHVTAGGSLCMELLTNDGWSPANDIESVLLQIRLAMCSTEPAPAQLMRGRVQSYSVDEAVSGFERSARMHGWRVPRGFTQEVLGMDAAQARRQ